MMIKKKPAAASSRTSEKRSQTNIGHPLRERRRELDRTLEDVAQAAGLTKSFLSEIERNRTSPSVASLVRLCEALSLPVAHLFLPAKSEVGRRDQRPPLRFAGLVISDFP